MKAIAPVLWGAAVIIVALLNIVDVLPDWATIAAILTLPFLAVATGTRCGLRKAA
ncbi:hypothetical protein AAG593_01500 [Citromicrobium bathyomarinum]|uniref:hypothetical protein n=1 Tax=Sphingomonadales TaxID=204457 RepID=UPI000A9B6ED7|nr:MULTISPECIES: hypothetical protein [Sphingomonadales]|tara:strand:+ start:1643 stop:1807 length:165 start_codon:yes stop_codon:yes gene_type:complete